MYEYNEHPFIVVWEVTRACALHCLHCRAEAQHYRNPLELSTEEGKKLLSEIRGMGNPLFVFTGGDPLMREDLFELAEYGIQSGLRVSITPSATPRVTRQVMERAKAMGFKRWAFSLDGSNAAIHDAFRGTKGSYDLTIRSLRTLRELGMPMQINTTVSRYNRADLPELVRVIQEFGVELWSVFFLVPTGRGKKEDMLSADEVEAVMEYLADLSDTVSFDIKTTAATHFRRVLLQKKGASVLQHASPSMRSRCGITDGNGFVFISHLGDVYPSGFLPIKCGNVRQTPLHEIYRDHPVFRALRDPDHYRGKCGVCEYRHVCGGSRARAYAVTGNPLESDPACAYVPKTWRSAAAE